MKMRLVFSILLGLFQLAVASGPEKEEPRIKGDFVMGVVHQNSVFTALGPLTLYQGDLFGDPPAVRRLTGYWANAEESLDFPPRWKLAHGELVFVNGNRMFEKPAMQQKKDFFVIGISLTELDRRIAERKKMPISPISPDLPVAEHYEFGWRAKGVWCDDENLVLDTIYGNIWRHVVDKVDRGRIEENPPFSKYEFFYDLQPVAKGACDYVVLASGPLQLDIEWMRKASVGKPPPGGAKKHPASRASLEWENAKEPLKPMLGVWHKDERGQWALVEQINDPCFNERFHAFVQGTTFFFVTDSGKVYVSKKPDNGERTIEQVWGKTDQAVTGALTDTASGKTFVFGCKGKPGAKDARRFYFELSEKPQLVEFDEQVLVREKVLEPLQTLKGYAHLLAADKKIKIEPKQEPEPKPKSGPMP